MPDLFIGRGCVDGMLRGPGGQLMTGDHSYVAFSEGSELRTAAADFLSEGLTVGQRVGYFGWGGSDALRQQANGLAGLDELIRKGTAQVTSLDDHFCRDVAPEPAALVAFWSAATFGTLRSADEAPPGEVRFENG